MNWKLAGPAISTTVFRVERDDGRKGFAKTHAIAREELASVLARLVGASVPDSEIAVVASYRYDMVQRVKRLEQTTLDHLRISAIDFGEAFDWKHMAADAAPNVPRILLNHADAAEIDRVRTKIVGLAAEDIEAACSHCVLPKARAVARLLICRATRLAEAHDARWRGESRL